MGHLVACDGGNNGDDDMAARSKRAGARQHNARRAVSMVANV